MRRADNFMAVDGGAIGRPGLTRLLAAAIRRGGREARDRYGARHLAELMQ
jgi:hypothetical protein